MTTAERPTATPQVAEYMRRPYLIEVVWDEDYWAATFPELPGLVAVADTWDELAEKIADAKESYFETALDAGLPIAEPGDRPEPASGRVLLRLPKTLHRQATRAAALDGVSVNTFLVSAVARELGRREPRQAASESARSGIAALMARPAAPRVGVALRHEIEALRLRLGRAEDVSVTAEDKNVVAELDQVLRALMHGNL